MQQPHLEVVVQAVFQATLEVVEDVLPSFAVAQNWPQQPAEAEAGIPIPHQMVVPEEELQE